MIKLKIFLLLICTQLSYSNYVNIISPQNFAYYFPHKYNFQPTDIGFNPYNKLVKGTLEYLESDIQNPSCSQINQRQAQFLLLEYEVFEKCSNYTFEYFLQKGYSMIIFHTALNQYLEYENMGLKIPVIQVTQIVWQDLIDHIIKEQPGTLDIEVFFNPPNQSYKLDIIYWMDIIDEKSYDFLYNFSVQKEDFKNRFIFQPRFPIYADPVAELNGFTFEVGHCLSSGRYCLSYSINEKQSQFSKFALEEIIRSICVFQQYQIDVWIEYQLSFYEFCIQQKLYGDFEQCSYHIMEQNSQQVISNRIIQQCYQNSFTFDRDGDTFFNWQRQINQLLEDEKKARKEYDVATWPTLLVNDLVYQGNLQDYNQLQDFLCSGYIQEPEVCNEWTSKAFNRDPIQSITVTDHFVSNHYYYLIGSIVVLIIIFAIYKFFKRSVQKDVQKEMALQVNSSVSQYWQFREEGSGRQSFDTDVQQA